jgi:hypothetical protein
MRALTGSLLLLATAVGHSSSSSTTASSSGGGSGGLPDLLSIDWQRLPDLEIYGSGFQNSDGGWVTPDSVVATFGHGHGTQPFLKTAHILNVTAAAASSCRGAGPGCAAAGSSGGSAWQRLPDAPAAVAARQDVASAVINGAVYIVGGFSYSAPYSYADFLKLAPSKVGRFSPLFLRFQ